MFDEALGLELPLSHPAVVTVLGKGNRTGIPAKHAPLLSMPLIIMFEEVACDTTAPYGMRYFDSAFFLMIMASLRFSDTKVVCGLWLTETAICGRSRDLKRKGRPISHWAAPSSGIHSDGKWLLPLMKMRNAMSPVEQGHRAIFFHSDTQWNVELTKFASYYLAIRS